MSHKVIAKKLMRGCSIISSLSLMLEHMIEMGHISDGGLDMFRTEKKIRSAHLVVYNQCVRVFNGVHENLSPKSAHSLHCQIHRDIAALEARGFSLCKMEDAA